MSIVEELAELLKRMNTLSGTPEENHINADDLLLAVVRCLALTVEEKRVTEEIMTSYRALRKWYS